MFCELLRKSFHDHLQEAEFELAKMRIEESESKLSEKDEDLRTMKEQLDNEQQSKTMLQEKLRETQENLTAQTALSMASEHHVSEDLDQDEEHGGKMTINAFLCPFIDR